MRLLKLVFRMILVAFSALFPMPTIVYWEHAVRQEEAWAEDPAHGPYRAACEEADILPGNCLDRWQTYAWGFTPGTGCWS